MEFVALAVVLIVASILYFSLGVLGLLKNSPVLVSSKLPLYLLAPLVLIWGVLKVHSTIIYYPGKGILFDAYPLLVVLCIAQSVISNRRGFYVIGARGDFVLKAVNKALAGHGLEYNPKSSRLNFTNSRICVHLAYSYLWGSWEIVVKGPNGKKFLEIIEIGVSSFISDNRPGVSVFEIIKLLIYGIFLFVLGVAVIPVH